MEHAKRSSRDGQPLIVVLQAAFIFVMDCKPTNPHRIADCEEYRPILAAEARCEAFLASCCLPISVICLQTEVHHSMINLNNHH